ncbi:hypothetical protein [Rhodococcus aetherivorans]|uniref:competence protein CoiA family protein n=1 Tax=Rhodococcus aetherivorans TaxID=191292 RepID=UPI001E43382A|nr:hypothetical protein [Rhodococcus aetherivorans]UGQ39383.1 hypothetical protein LRQ66_14295 [Rhodococcus aetherivorans]
MTNTTESKCRSLYRAEDAQGDPITPADGRDQGVTGYCPDCGEPVFPRCGSEIVDHWAHYAHDQGEPRPQDYTWRQTCVQELPGVQVLTTPKASRDVDTPGGRLLRVVDVSIPGYSLMQEEREHGPGLVWMFDERNACRSHRLTFQGYTGEEVDGRKEFRYRWANPRRTIRRCERPVFLDLDSDTKRFRLTGVERDGWDLLITGTVWTTAEFRDFLATPPPMESAVATAQALQRLTLTPEAKAELEERPYWDPTTKEVTDWAAAAWHFSPERREFVVRKNRRRPRR